MLDRFGALNYFREQEHKINALSATLKTTPDNLDKKLDNILADNKALQKENEKLKAQINNNKSKDISQNAEQINGISILATFVEADDVAGLRNIMDSMRDSLPNSVIILAATFDEKTAIITSVNGSAKDQGLHAGKIIKEVSSFCNGSGGGRNDMAQAGTKETDAAIITDALTKGIAIIKDLLSC